MDIDTYLASHTERQIWYRRQKALTNLAKSRKEIIVCRYNAGCSSTKLATAYEISHTAIINILRTAKVQMRPVGCIPKRKK